MIIFQSRTSTHFLKAPIINPHGFITIWADQETISTGLHANFKLSTSGEQLMLSDGSTIVLDSLSFGAQLANVSMARCPDGVGNFSITLQQTYNGSNCIDGLTSHSNTQATCFPNPSNGLITINFRQGIQKNNLLITNLVGDKILYFTSLKNKETIDLSSLSNGMYFIVINNEQTIKLLINQ